MSSSYESLILSAYGLSFSYPGNEVLKNVSVEVYGSRIVGVLGPNGSGKSTLLKLLSGLIPLPPQSGIIKYMGGRLQDLSQGEKAKRVAYVGSDLLLDFPMTGFEAVMLGRTSHVDSMFPFSRRQDSDVIHWAMDQSFCWDLRSRDVQSLSGGERQKLSIARALAQQARVLLLDEALSKMDLHHQIQLSRRLSTLTRTGMSVVIVSHDINFLAEFTEEVWVVQEGELVRTGATQDVMTDQLFEKLYPGSELKVLASPLTHRPKVYFSKGGSDDEKS